MTLTKLIGLGLLEGFPDKDYREVIQDKLEDVEESPYAVASAIGKYLQPVLARARSEEDWELVCWICDVFMRIKKLVFNEDVICSANCEVGLKRILHRALEAYDGRLGISESVGVPKGLSEGEGK